MLFINMEVLGSVQYVNIGQQFVYYKGVISTEQPKCRLAKDLAWKLMVNKYGITHTSLGTPDY